MRAMLKLFGRSPFTPLQSHMDRVGDCVHKISELFELLNKGEQEKVEALANEISELEHAADVTKNNIRNNLPKGIFLPVDRGNLLEILALQDSLADIAEDIAILTTLSPLKMPEVFREDFQNFLDKNISAFEVARQIISELDKLIATSFGGSQAEEVKAKVDDVAYKEHEVDILQRKLLQKLFANEDSFSKGAFILWLKIFQQVGSLSNIAEKLGNRVRMTLDVQ